MATSSETDSDGTVWTVTTSDGEAQIKRQREWPHYLVACRGGMWIVEGSDFGRAHDAALAAIRATRGEAQPEPQHAVGEWWQVDDDRWSSKAGEWEFAVLRVDAERGEDGALHGGRWAWDALCLARNVEHEGECATRDEAMAAAEAAARGEQPTTTEWRQIDGGHWVREVGGLRVEVHHRLGGTWWSVTEPFSRYADVCIFARSVPAGDLGGAREDADYWLRARGVL